MDAIAEDYCIGGVEGALGARIKQGLRSLLVQAGRWLESDITPLYAKELTSPKPSLIGWSTLKGGKGVTVYRDPYSLA